MAPKRPKGAGALEKDTRPALSPAPVPSRSSELYAALDLGTNSCRMLIAQPKGSGFHVVDSFSKSVQLGAGLERTGRLSRGSMLRTIQALRICQQKLRRNKVRRMRLVATEACRRALNGTEFMRRIHRETGLKLDIITPKEEAQLAVISCAPLVDSRTENLLVVDIGGGRPNWSGSTSAVCRSGIGHSRSCGFIRGLIKPNRGCRRQRSLTGFPCLWGLQPCATSLRMSKTMPRGLP